MALVFVMLLALSGAYAASLPALPDLSLPDVLETSLDSALEALGSEKVRRTVLDDVKQLLDTQISSLLQDGVKRIAGKKGILKRRLKSKRKSRRPLPLIQDERKAPSESVSHETDNSELVKVITDGSLQDSADIALRKSVDEILEAVEEEKINRDEGESTDRVDNETIHRVEDEIIDQDEINDSEIIPDNGNDDQVNVEKLINSHEDETINENDLSRDISHEKKHKQISNEQVHSKEINHVIIEHLPKKHANVETLDNIVDLDEILKSTLKDLSDSSSHEDEVKDGDDDLDDENRSHQIKIYHKSNTKPDKSEPSRRQSNDRKSKQHKLHQVKIDSEEKHVIEDSVNGPLDTNNNIQIVENKLHEDESKSNENNGILKNDILTDTNRIYDRNHNKEEDSHPLSKQTDETSESRHNDSKHHHSNKHSRHHHHKKHIIKHENKKSDHESEDKLYSSNSSHVSKVQIDDKKSRDHDHKSDVSTQEEHVSEVKEKSDTESYVDEHITSKKDLARNRNKHKNASKEKKRVTNQKNVIGKNESVMEKEINANDDKQSDESVSPVKEEKDIIKEEDNTTEKDRISTDDKQDGREKKQTISEEIQYNSEEKLKIIEDTKYVINDNNANSEAKESSEEEERDSEEKKDTIKENETKKNEPHICGTKNIREPKGELVHSAESSVLHDLIYNKDMTKSYTFTMKFTTK